MVERRGALEALVTRGTRDALPRSEVWRGRRVLLTGHTGFKGSWLVTWLHLIGAEVVGFSRGLLEGRSLFRDAALGEIVDDRRGDVRSAEDVVRTIGAVAPHIVLHLAAQPLVRTSYQIPVETYATNVLGTVHVLEAARNVGEGCPVLVVTSDKCYENREQADGYAEAAPLGGTDPYAASKACADIVASSYARSFGGRTRFQAASARAGNVIGGGDWARDRLVPDLVRGLSAGEAVVIRHPDAVRPWQHVLEPLAGYLLLAERMLEGNGGVGAWNFGPRPESEVAVRDVADALCGLWGVNGGWVAERGYRGPHEATLLRLASTKARDELGWRPRWSLAQALAASVEVYRSNLGGRALRCLLERQIREYAETRPTV